MKKTQIMQKMIAYYQGNRSDIEHFIKVHAYAALMGQLEGLDDTTQNTLEWAAIVHDISCPFCRKKYGNTHGSHQEAESEALLRPFLAEFALSAEVQERIIYLVCHHHTYTHIDGKDHQILIEADFLVNASESDFSMETIQNFRNKMVKTAAGRHLFDWIYPNLA